MNKFTARTEQLLSMILCELRRISSDEAVEAISEAMGPHWIAVALTDAVSNIRALSIDTERDGERIAALFHQLALNELSQHNDTSRAYDNAR
jgi:hypothetical protein